ncbi:MAG: energy-coupling factor transporter transmembrane protein EcfT [Erysipelotrichaceae bacterium]|nr:energy-coupling factor transporter transmembrane protein EcfT [Erysipelotrichaceae bacterium]MBQ4252062.1 energy-coupling factor transporter transmembrane protein EcfT [Erysipelotrichaceae bacterium]MBQ7223014.1 energy-coupling factor transporter transmembrane protein EcfT [Erysipelotrichaceae bacterium]
MKNITLGQYIPLDSFFHRLDPRSKICAMVAMMIAVFIPAGFIGYALIGAILIMCVFISRLQVDFIIKAMKPMIFMMIFLFVVNIFVVKSGTLLVSFWIFNIYSGAIIETLYIVIRLLLMIMITTLLTATTKPMDLTLGLEHLMGPLEKIKVPTHDIAMMVALALRFIPTLIEEADRILKAQASRGVDLENGTLREKINAILSLIVPMFVSCFQRADDLADAMEARGYAVGAPRVRYKKLAFTAGDYIVIIGANLVLLAVIAIKIWVIK